MSRPPRAGTPTTSRERLRLDFTRSGTVRQIYPHLAEIRVEFEFADGTERAPSPQAFSYFPAARGFFRYACPCHSCNGEFDLSDRVAELAARSDASERTQRFDFHCSGERAQAIEARVPCPVGARVRMSAIPRPTR